MYNSSRQNYNLLAWQVNINAGLLDINLNKVIILVLALKHTDFVNTYMHTDTYV